ncbi:MAG: response regulator [Burkholderiales bacterium]|nr:response regulator [Burkholderiales bacterium]
MESHSTSVLIADDNNISLELLRGILASLGYSNIKRAKDGEAVLKFYGDEKPEVIFLDINMPGKNGLDTLKDLREINPNAFVVMVTGESSAENIQQSLARGAQGFVVKPYSAGRIKDVLEKYQKSKQPSAASA